MLFHFFLLPIILNRTSSKEITINHLNNGQSFNLIHMENIECSTHYLPTPNIANVTKSEGRKKTSIFPTLYAIAVKIMLAQLQLSFVGDVPCSLSLHFVVLTRTFISLQVKISRSVRFPITIRTTNANWKNCYRSTNSDWPIGQIYYKISHHQCVPSITVHRECLFIYIVFVIYSSTALWSNTCLRFIELSVRSINYFAVNLWVHACIKLDTIQIKLNKKKNKINCQVFKNTIFNLIYIIIAVKVAKFPSHLTMKYIV